MPVTRIICPRFFKCTYGAIAAVTVLLSACSDRSRENPFDPRNPETQGRPTGTAVISVLDTIRVSWQPMALRDLTGYTVYRKLAGEPDFSPLAEISARSNHYEDRSHRFGILHQYRVVVKVGAEVSPPSDEVAITPGPTIAWLADVNDGTLVKLTHDGRHELLRTFAFPAPERVKIDARRGNVWVLDEFTGRLGRVNFSGADKQIFDDFVQPVDLVLDGEDGSIWVADSLERSLRRYDAGGVLAAQNDSLPKLAAFALNPFYHEMWAISADGLELLRLSKQAALVQRVPLPVAVGDDPIDLEVHAATGSAWLSLRRRVVLLNAEGRFLQASTYAFRKALRLAVDQNSGECWVIDETLQYRQSRVLKLDLQGAVAYQFEGLDRPQSLAVNPFDSSCYVTDSLRGRVVRISKEGELQTVFAGLITPVDIDIANLLQ